MNSRDTATLAAPAIKSGGFFGDEMRAMATGLMITTVGAMMGLAAAFALHTM